MNWSTATAAAFRDTDVHFVDTVCQPTKDRQQALRDLAAESDVVVVVGGPESNNSRKLAELAPTWPAGLPCRHCASELRPEWFADLLAGRTHRRHFDAGSRIDEVRVWLESH